MKITSLTLEKKCRAPSDFPRRPLPEVAFAGRSNVGKSSLINSLVARKRLVAVSSQPGKTRSIDFFLVNERFRLVDLPGYGYAKVSQRMRDDWKVLIESYLRNRENLVSVVWILDIRRDLSDLDRMLEQWLDAYGVPYLPVCTKADKVPSGKRGARLGAIRKSLVREVDPVLYSARTGLGKAALWKSIYTSLSGGSGTPMNNRPIGIFDSGVGGLTVLKQLLRQLPGEEMIYLGDTARLPYGIKSSETVARYSVNNAAFLLEKNVKFLVVACNTASALALDELQSRFSVPLTGVILPGAERAALASRNGRVGVIGTVATVRSGAYEQAIRSFNDRVHVVSQACPLFVSLAEEGWIEDDITMAVAHRYLDPVIAEGIDVLVLGCTHYPLLKPVLSRLAGDSVLLVDSAEETAVQARRTLEAKGLLADPSSGVPTVPPRIYLTDCSPHFLELSRKILEFPPEHVEYVNVG